MAQLDLAAAWLTRVVLLCVSVNLAINRDVKNKKNLFTSNVPAILMDTTNNEFLTETQVIWGTDINIAEIQRKFKN